MPCDDTNVSGVQFQEGEEDVEMYVPGNSVNETGERMKGGAVREDKSPENEAILKRIKSVRSIHTIVQVRAW